MTKREKVAAIHRIIDQKASNEEEFAELVKDPLWRIGNLYSCQTKDPNAPVVKFIPKLAQCLLLYEIFTNGWKRILVLKARQQGFSTLIAIFGLDYVMFNKDTNFNIVSIDEDSAQSLLEGKVKFAFDNLEDPHKALTVVEGADPPNNRSEFKFDKNWGVTSKTSHRSGTSHILHSSELGVLSNTDKKKANEFITGTLPTCGPEAYVFLESTAKGGATGVYWDLWNAAVRSNPEERTTLTYLPYFSPSFDEPDYQMNCKVEWITDETITYFEGLKKYWLIHGYAEEDTEWTKEQMYWYQKTKEITGRNMLEEYPNTPEEAFTAPIEGEVYADEIYKARSEGRICNFRYDETLPVFAAVDKGWEHASAVWLLQITQTGIDCIWYHEAKHKSPQYFVNEVTKAGFTPIRWALPWDCYTGDPKVSWERQFKQAGAQGVVRIHRTQNAKRDRVDIGLNMIRRVRWLESDCEVGITNLERFSWPEGKSKPLDNAYTDGADAWGHGMCAIKQGLFTANMKNITTRDIERDLMKGMHRKNKGWELPSC